MKNPTSYLKISSQDSVRTEAELSVDTEPLSTAPTNFYSSTLDSILSSKIPEKGQLGVYQKYKSFNARFKIPCLCSRSKCNSEDLQVACAKPLASSNTNKRDSQKSPSSCAFKGFNKFTIPWRSTIKSKWQKLEIKSSSSKYLEKPDSNKTDSADFTIEKKSLSTRFNCRKKCSNEPDRHNKVFKWNYQCNKRDDGNFQDSPREPSQKYSYGALPLQEMWRTEVDERRTASQSIKFKIDQINIYSEFSEVSKFGKWRGKVIGTGATAHVRLLRGKGSTSNQLFAVKEFRRKTKSETEDEYFQKIISEFTIAKSAHHPNIVETYRLYKNNKRWSLVMEFCEQGDLFNLISRKYLGQKNRHVDRHCLFKQLIQGLNYLHSNGIVHGDVKPENLLITNNSKLKISDFGISNVIYGSHLVERIRGVQGELELVKLPKPSGEMCGSRPYAPPEAIARSRLRNYDLRALDVWAAAIVMLCMIANGVLWLEPKVGSSQPYDQLINGWENWEAEHASKVQDDSCECRYAGNNSVSTPVRLAGAKTENNCRNPQAVITSKDYPHVAFLEDYISPPALRRILLSMLNPNPERRISIADVANSRWLRNVECCELNNSLNLSCITIDAGQGKCFYHNGEVCPFPKYLRHNHLP